MLFTAKERLNIGFVRTLQLAFQTNEEFKWDPNPTVSKVHIYSEYPAIDVQLPAVMVSVGGGDAMMRTINDEVRDVLQEDITFDGLTMRGTTGYEFGGGFSPVVRIEVTASDSLSRSRVLDWVTMYIRWFFWEKLRVEGINVSEMTFGSPSVQLIGNQLRHVDSLSIGVYTEWNHTVGLSEADRINGICLSGVFSLLDGATISS